MTVNDILMRLFSEVPAWRKETWDNVGLACGRSDRAVHTVLVALDPLLPVLQEAKACGAQLVVTHHPMTMDGQKQVNDLDVTGRAMLFAMETGLSVMNLHTNLDCAPGGVNDVLAALLEMQNPKILCEAGKDYGYIRYGTCEATALPAFLETVKRKLQCPGLRFVDGGRPVQTFAVGGGSCGIFLQQVAELGCDTFVTADVKYHQFCEAKQLGLNLIDAGHFETENPVCGYLESLLRSAFPELTVIRSKTHRDAIQFL